MTSKDETQVSNCKVSEKLIYFSLEWNNKVILFPLLTCCDAYE